MPAQAEIHPIHSLIKSLLPQWFFTPLNKRRSYPRADGNANGTGIAVMQPLKFGKSPDAGKTVAGGLTFSFSGRRSQSRKKADLRLGEKPACKQVLRILPSLLTYALFLPIRQRQKAV